MVDSTRYIPRLYVYGSVHLRVLLPFLSQKIVLGFGGGILNSTGFWGEVYLGVMPPIFLGAPLPHSIRGIACLVATNEAASR